MKRPLRWILIGLGVLALLVGLGIWRAHRRATETFEASDRRVAELIAEIKARDGRRPTLGEPVPDADARPIYEAVLARVRALSGRDEEIADWLGGSDHGQAEPSESEREAFYVRTAGMLEDLRPALRAPIVRPGQAFEEDPEGRGTRISAWQTLSKLTTAHVKHRLERGEAAEALDLCVLLAFAGRDLMRHGGLLDPLVGLGILRSRTDEIRRILADRPVDAVRLERLAEEAELLHRDTPSATDMWEFEEIFVRRILRHPEALEDESIDGGLTAVSWRYLFSPRLLVADALEHLSATRASFDEAVRGKSGAAAVASSRQRLDALAEDPNHLLRMIFAVHPMTVRRCAEFEMHLDLLRVTVAVARYRAERGAWPRALEDLVPALLPAVPDCAYSGEPFRHVEGRVWSVGGDGDDDGGRANADDDIEGDGDVVWKVNDPSAEDE